MEGIRLRFFFTKNGGFARRTKRTTDEAAVVIMRAVSLFYSKNIYNRLVSDIRQRIEKDIQFEINHMARLYRNFIINAPKTKNAPVAGARLSPAATNFPGGPKPLAIPGGAWSPRDPKYVKRKKREGYSEGWWYRTGEMRSILGFGKGWQSVFGDRIKVTVRRVSSQESSASAVRAAARSPAALTLRPNAAMANRTTLRMAIANIEVTALEKIDLGTLRSSMLEAAYDFDGAGDTQLGGRLAQTAHQTGKERVTLEPFLEFVITRSFPHAIRRRLQTGLGARIRDFSDAPKMRS